MKNALFNVIPVTDYDPFEAKFAASLYWLVFRATEDGKFDNIPSQVTSPIQRDLENRITVRPEVKEFLTSGNAYCKVCSSIFCGEPPVFGQWAVIQTLSHHGFYVVEEGDIAVTDSALQQRKPFRKSTHLALMDCLMSAFSAQVVTVQQVVQCVSKISSFNSSKELPFDMEDALLLWINKLCSVLNDNQLKKQKLHAEQLLQNQDKAKRFRFRRDQLQPKIQTEFPVMEDLLKDISDGQNLLGIVLFYQPTVISLEDIRFDKNLSTAHCIHNLELFRSLCSQFICTSVLALKLEDILYGSQAMKPNIIALLAEIFQKCEIESPKNDAMETQMSNQDIDLRCDAANKENVVDNMCSSVSVLNTDSDSERFSAADGHFTYSSSDHIELMTSSAMKSQKDSQVKTKSHLSFKSPFQLDFTVDDDLLRSPSNGPQHTNDKTKEKENPFSGILRRPVLVGDRKHGLPCVATSCVNPQTTPRHQEQSLLTRRNKQKQRTINDFEEWDIQHEEVEELKLNDLQRSQSLTGLDRAKLESTGQSFHAWREDTGTSSSDSNLACGRNERISLDFRPNVATTSVPQRSAEGINLMSKSSGSKGKRDEQTDSPVWLSTDSLNIKEAENCNPRDSVLSGVRDSYLSDISVKELNQFEEIEAAVQAGRSVETPRTFAKPKNKFPKAATSQEDEDELNTSVSSEDMNMFRLEVLQRLTEDKLRQIPDGTEMEDDDDPILLARSNLASSRNSPVQPTRLEVQNAPIDVPSDQLSPITESAESAVSNPNSVSSANSTAPSSPCSPLDVAPFMPTFFTTSPANSLDRRNQRMGMKDTKEVDEATLVGQEDDFPNDPVASVTPRLTAKNIPDFPPQKKSFEQLARGSYTVGHASVESAKAAGLPVIGGNETMTGSISSLSASQELVLDNGKTKLNTEATESEGFEQSNQSQRHTHSSLDSAARPLVFCSAGIEASGVAVQGVDGRQDSLESSPAHSPSLTRGKRDQAFDKAALRSHGLAAQDSPSDVVIFDRSSSVSCACGNEPSSSQTRENTSCDSKSNKTEEHVFDFDQDAIRVYGSDHPAKDFGTYKKNKQVGLPISGVPQGTLLGVSFGSDVTSDVTSQRLDESYNYATYNRTSQTNVRQEPSDVRQQETANAKEFDYVDGKQHHVTCEETPSANIDSMGHSDGFSTFRKVASSAENIEETAYVSHSLNLRQSDGFSTFRKQETKVGYGADVATGNHQSNQFSMLPEPSLKETNKNQQQSEDKSYHIRDADDLEVIGAEEEASSVNDVRSRQLPTNGGENDRQGHTYPGRGEDGPVRVSDTTNISRSRTFRKNPDGQIVRDLNTDVRGSSGSRMNTSSKVAEQHTERRSSLEGSGNDPSHRISWTDESEAGARLLKQLNTTSETLTSPTNSPRRHGSPKQLGRGSPGARISWLTAATRGIGGQVMLNNKGEIEASQGEAEDDQAVTSQLALLRMQLDEKRRLIEAEKHRAQTEWEDQRRRLGQTAFWYVIGKAQGSEGTVMQTESQDKQRKAMGEFSDQVSPPIAWSSPANSPLPSTVIQSSSDGQQLETREFLLSDYPPGVNENMHPLSESAVELNSRDSPVPPRPPSHDSAATRNAAFARKCWDVDVGVKASPVPLTRPDSTAGSEDIKQGTALSEGCITKELEEENHSSVKKGLAMFIGDDHNVGSQGLTPEQEKKKEKFLRLRQKKQEEDRTRKEAELEKKRKRDEKLREKEILRKMEQERLRQDDLERVRIEQEMRTKEAQATRVADPQGTYRRQGPWQQAYDVSGDANGYIGQGHQQPSGFAEFSGPQCYVKPSGKSNRKIIVNAISHVCLSGTVNQEQKEKCLQALSECDGHHFMILFRDGLKFRGIYIHNLDNDQLYKVFGIGPRLVTSKMIEFLYKYNSGGKEFTKIPSKTISLSVDGFGIQKSCWNTGKPVVASKTSSNLKRPPRPPQR